MERTRSLGLLVVSLGLAFTACGPFERSGESLGPEANLLSCRWNERGKTPPPVAQPPTSTARAPMALAGQMTEEAANAKRLFDQERFSEAQNALVRVENGETGDDEGNREVAAYHLGIVYFRLRKFEAAVGVFARIASRPEHLKFAEAELWLARLTKEPVSSDRAIDALYAYSDDVSRKFDNPQQRDLYWLIQFTSARSAFRNGDMTAARQRFQRIAEPSPYVSLASDCLRFVQ